MESDSSPEKYPSEILQQHVPQRKLRPSGHRQLALSDNDSSTEPAVDETAVKKCEDIKINTKAKLSAISNIAHQRQRATNSAQPSPRIPRYQDPARIKRCEHPDMKLPREFRRVADDDTLPDHADIASTSQVAISLNDSQDSNNLFNMKCQRSPAGMTPRSGKHWLDVVRECYDADLTEISEEDDQTEVVTEVYSAVVKTVSATDQQTITYIDHQQCDVLFESMDHDGAEVKQEAASTNNDNDAEQVEVHAIRDSEQDSEYSDMSI